VIADGQMVKCSSGGKYTFDAVLGPECSQHDLYSHCGRPMVDALFDGFDCCLFAYGQTGSGKTYSMLGGDGGQRRAQLDGMIPCVSDDIFRRIAADGIPGTEYDVSLRYVEVYNGYAYDLLTDDQSVTSRRKALQIVEVADGTFKPRGATELRVQTTRKLMSIISAASSRRCTAQNSMHEHSSRSHAMLSVSVDRKTAMQVKGKHRSQRMQLHLVDLAGSERASSSAANEGINEGLLALGRVLSALAKTGEGGAERETGRRRSSGHAAHVPYRDAALTKLLRGSIGGNSRTMMLACVSPGNEHMAETINTLSYAQQAAAISMNAIRARTEVYTEPDPMAGDVYDTEPQLDRRALWIPTKGHGDIFARVCGDPDAPLVLVSRFLVQQVFCFSSLYNYQLLYSTYCTWNPSTIH
jgi:kinesin family protein 4/21/27